ncbi:MAG: SUMF1/EgtB/PvdO family nonheme iron enzyme [Planctomycetota bacterium]
MRSVEPQTSENPADGANDYQAEESLLRGLAEWAGDDYEAESHCGRALARVQAFADTRGDGSRDTEERSHPNANRSKVGPYQLLGFIGQGGMGRVFKARHDRLGRVVALKVLGTASARKTHTAKRFQREMRALGRIEHPNIVTASDAGVRDGVHFLAMEFVDGISFAEIRRYEGALEIADACELTRQTAIALAAAHEIGMVHRDIKPSNLMLSIDGDGKPRVKVLDFGLALFRNETDRTDELTRSDQVVGTFQYMAPEQCLNSHTVDHRADLYALGATVNRLMCDVSSTDETQSELTPMQKLLRRTEEPLPSIATRRPDLPRGLVELIDELLQGDPELRPDSAARIAQDLEPYCAGHQLENLFHRLPRTPLDTSLNHLTVVAPATLADGPDRRRSLWGFAAVALIAAAMGWLGLSDRFRRKETRPAPFANPSAADSSEPNPAVGETHDQSLWDLTTSLVGYWPVTSDSSRLLDRSGGGLHLNLSGTEGAISKERAPAGGPHSLEVTRLKHPLVIQSSRTAAAATISFWFRGKKEGPDSKRFLGQGDTTGFETRFGCGQSAFPGHLIFRVPSPEGESSTLTSKVSFATRAWHHIAIVNEDDSSSLYIDGSLDQSFDKKLIDFTKPLEIGGDDSISAIELDEIALFDRTLTQKEIRKLITTRLTPSPMRAELRAADVVGTQEAWAQHLGVPPRWTNSVGMEFCLIPPGEYLMGSTQEIIDEEIAGDGREPMWDRYRSEGPQHVVQITEPFYLGRHEVTQAQYRSVTGGNPSYFQPSGGGDKWIQDVDCDSLPVESVSWIDAIGFCQQLSQLEKHPINYHKDGEEFRMTGTGYRLPTEAEWEFACRAATVTRWSCGEKDGLKQHAYWVGNSPRRPSPVGTLSPNALGLHDIHGNVFEWCFDYYDEAYYANELDPSSNPTGPETGLRRVYRGGSWWQRKSQTRSAFRGHHFPSFQFQEHGMRVAISASAVKQALRSLTD